tara:strand:+ start:79138 stop:79902 length:765 start_codon:yes stop_codon:yes gene_type:complete
MNILEKIISHKRDEISSLECDILPTTLNKTISLKKCLSSSGISVIAEIKMKSPSEGVIFSNADPIQIAKDYESAGAAAISVLTDKLYFGGSLEILKSVKKAVSIPVLRKDFIIHKLQINETFLASADAFLLIAEAIKNHDLKSFIEYGKKINLETLVEFHSKENLEIIVDSKPSLVGVNCRNLKTMQTDIKYFSEMARLLPDQLIKVAESGIHTRDDLSYVADQGYNAALIGTSLMKTKNPGKALEELLGGYFP